MNRDFMQLILDKCNYSADAKEAVFSFMDTVALKDLENDMDTFVSLFRERGYRAADLKNEAKSLTKKLGVSVHTLWLVTILLSAESAQENYRKKGISDDIFWTTFEDLRFKAQKCKNIYGVWGTFVPFWYSIFCRAEIVRFGCLEFENKAYKYDTPYVCGDVVVNKGDPVKSIHIPASGEPFDRESRIKAYKMAYEFFRKESGDKPFIGICSSWLLYPEYKDILPENSNIRTFMDEFDIIHVHEEENFSDIWRVFGPDKDKPYAELPEKTSLQRAFKTYLLGGGTSGEGVGMMTFDGEKIVINKK